MITTLTYVFNNLEENLDGYISANEIINFLINNGDGDLNEDNKINLRDAIYKSNNGSSFSPLMDGMDNDSNGYTDDLIGLDLSGYSGQADNDPFPKLGVANDGDWAHGTHVAGILAAVTDNLEGIASPVYNAKILSVKCSREDGSNPDLANINNGYEGILYAAKAGFYSGYRTIINNSCGSSNPPSSSEQSIINIAFNNYNSIIITRLGSSIYSFSFL